MLYPNPAKEFVNIEARGIEEISLYDISGRLIWNAELSSPETQISLMDFTSGYYILQIQTRNRKHALKLVVKK